MLCLKSGPIYWYIFKVPIYYHGFTKKSRREVYVLHKGGVTPALGCYLAPTQLQLMLVAWLIILMLIKMPSAHSSTLLLMILTS